MRLIVRSMFIKLEDKRPKAMDGILMLYKTTQIQINDVLKELDLANCELKRYTNIVVKLLNCVEFSPSISDVDKIYRVRLQCVGL